MYGMQPPCCICLQVPQIANLIFNAQAIIQRASTAHNLRRGSGRSGGNSNPNEPAAKEAAEKVSHTVIPNEVRNLSEF
jgi:hypothetical protein